MAWEFRVHCSVRELLLWNEEQLRLDLDKLEFILDLKKPPVPNKYYVCPSLVIGDNSFAYPVISHKPHSDPDFGVFVYHNHVDWRFIDAEPDYKVALKVDHTCVHFSPFKCVRASATPLEPILEGLQEKYQGRELKCGLCPHRGSFLLNAKKDKDGSFHCNMHGMKFNKEGKVI